MNMTLYIFIAVFLNNNNIFSIFYFLKIFFSKFCNNFEFEFKIIIVIGILKYELLTIKQFPI